ncbi:MAG: HutD family protein [Gammaproteobacteria bacterium]|nr:HutD family protein [Gammaproteobacteria bacterium]
MHIVRSRDYPRLPWKNGLGVSQIIAASPDGAGYDDLHWQVSITGIEASCPFSQLPGIERHFMLLEGSGIELECRDDLTGAAVRHRIDTALEPISFSGDWRTECSLPGGPVRVLNVVTRRGLASARIRTHAISDRIVLERSRAELLVAFVASGALVAESSGAQAEALDTIVVERQAEGEIAFLPVNGTPARLVEIAIPS